MILLDLDLSGLKAELEKIGEKGFRAKQILKWLCEGVPFEEMTDLSKNLRQKLKITKKIKVIN